MSRVVMARITVLVSLVAFLGGPVAGQSSPKKPTQKKPPAKTAPAKSEAAAKPAAAADIRIRTRYTSGAQISENTTYVKGGRQRVEFPGVISVEQGDLGRTLMINPASKTYLVKPYAKDAPAPASTAARSRTGGLNGASQAAERRRRRRRSVPGASRHGGCSATERRRVRRSCRDPDER